MYKVLNQICSIDDVSLIERFGSNKVLRQTWGFENMYSLEEQLNYAIRLSSNDIFDLDLFRINGGTPSFSQTLFYTSDKDLLRCINVPLDSIKTVEITGVVFGSFVEFSLCLSSWYGEAILIVNYYGDDNIDNYIKSIALKP